MVAETEDFKKNFFLHQKEAGSKQDAFSSRTSSNRAGSSKSYDHTMSILSAPAANFTDHASFNYQQSKPKDSKKFNDPLNDLLDYNTNKNKAVGPIQRPPSNSMNTSSTCSTFNNSLFNNFSSWMTSDFTQKDNRSVDSSSIINSDPFSQFKLFGCNDTHNQMNGSDEFSIWNNNKNQPWNSVLINDLNCLSPSQSHPNETNLYSSSSGNIIKSLWSDTIEDKVSTKSTTPPLVNQEQSKSSSPTNNNSTGSNQNLSQA